MVEVGLIKLAEKIKEIKKRGENPLFISLLKMCD